MCFCVYAGVPLCVEGEAEEGIGCLCPSLPSLLIVSQCLAESEAHIFVFSEGGSQQVSAILLSPSSSALVLQAYVGTRLACYMGAGIQAPVLLFGHESPITIEPSLNF